MAEEFAKLKAEDNARFLEWLKSKKVIIYAKERKDGERAKEYVKTALEAMGFDVENFNWEIRQLKKDVLGGDTVIHAWLGEKKMKEPALHVYVGKFEGYDSFGKALYRKIASGVPLMGTLVIHSDYVRGSGELNPHIVRIIVHELGHVIAGLKHEDAHRLRIMNPLNPVLDEKSKAFFHSYLEKLENVHGTEYLKREKKKPWWKFW